MPSSVPSKPRTIGERVRAIRRVLGLTQTGLAARCGGQIKQSGISSIETGDTKWLRGGNLLRIADALGVSVAWLETGVGDPQKPIASGTDDAAVLDIAGQLSTENRAIWLAHGEFLISRQRVAPPSKAAPYGKTRVK